MPRLARWSLAIAAVCAAASCGAATDAELRVRITACSKTDNAASASALMTILQECSARIQAQQRVPLGRRPFEVLMSEIQDAVTKIVSPDAQKVYAGALSKLSLDGLTTLAHALKSMPPNADVDLAAARLLAMPADFRVRTVLIDVLGAHRCAAAVETIIAALNPNEAPAVQIAACRALANIRDKKAVAALVKYMVALPPRGGRYVHEVTTALRALTGEKLPADPSQWKKWWDETQPHFAFGVDNTEPDYNYELFEKQDLEYYEVPVVENRLVIVLDTSGSMILGGKPTRMDSAKSALKELIAALPEKALFNIVVFSNNVRRWHKDVPLMPATVANKKDATKFIDMQTPGGGTQTAMAMEEVLRDLALANGCETVYLVTDGNPTPWAANVTPDQQERVISWFNQALKIRINTIGIYTSSPKEDAALIEKEDPEKMKKFLMDIAGNNDGVYREVSVAGSVVKLDPRRAKDAEKEKAEKEKAEKEKAEKEEKDKEAAEKKAPENPMEPLAPPAPSAPAKPPGKEE
jgi:hypothetical protein